MKKYLLLFGYLIVNLSFFAQSLDDLDFGTDTTFEVVTWNIEWFPKNGELTMNYVADMIEALDADVIAVQEIDDQESFHNMLNNMTDYDGYYVDYGYLALGYIYKSDVVQINSIYEIYTGSAYSNPFPRPPLVLELTFMGENYIIINNHYKCCGNGILEEDDSWDEETRRFLASDLLKEYIDTNFPDEQVLVLGDLNDVITDVQENNVFQSFIDDSDNYVFADMDIAQGSNTNWSYPNWPSHIDHILITNELFDEFGNTNSSIQTIKMENYLTNGWSEYDTNVSDHRPVGLKIASDSFIGVDDFDIANTKLRNYPNPVSFETTIHFNTSQNMSRIEIFASTGQKVHTIHISNGQNTSIWNVENFPNGLYLAKYRTSNGVMASCKILVVK